MDKIKKYFKHLKNPSPADRQLAEAYDNYTNPIMDYTFTPEYRAYVKKFWNDCHIEYLKALAEKQKQESGFEDSPEVVAKALAEHRKLYPSWKKEDLHPALIKMDEYYRRNKNGN